MPNVWKDTYITWYAFPPDTENFDKNFDQIIIRQRISCLNGFFYKRNSDKIVDHPKSVFKYCNVLSRKNVRFSHTNYYYLSKTVRNLWERISNKRLTLFDQQYLHQHSER